MRREILLKKRERHISGCCPGHDQYPTDTYNCRPSLRAKRKSQKKEHRYIRRFFRMLVKNISE